MPPVFDPSAPFTEVPPSFDPSKPFTDAAPSFDPTKPFEEAPAQKLGMSASPSVGTQPEMADWNPEDVGVQQSPLVIIGQGLEHGGTALLRGVRDLPPPLGLGIGFIKNALGIKPKREFVISPGQKELTTREAPDSIQPGRSVIMNEPVEQLGGRNGMAELGYGLTTPGNLALGAMLPGEGPVSTVAKTLFGVQGGVGVAQDVPKYFNPQTKNEAEVSLPMDLVMLLGGAHGLMPKGVEGMTRAEALTHSRDMQIEHGGQPDPFNIEQKPGVTVEGTLPVNAPVETPPVATTAPPQRQLSPDESINLQHEMKGLAQGVMYAKYMGKEVQPIVDAADKVWEKAHQTGDYEGALAEIATLKGQLSGRVKAKEEGTAPTPTSVLTPGFEARQEGPSALAAGVVEGRKYPAMSKEEVSALETGLEEPKLSGPPTVLAEFKGETNDGTQMLNRLRNKLPPAEWDVYQKAGIESEFQGKKVPVASVAKWMEDNGPKVEVHTYGMEGKVSENRQNYDSMTHNWWDRLDEKTKDQFNSASALRNHRGVTDFDEFNDVLKSHGWEQGQIEQAQKYTELRNKAYNEPESSGPRATSAYSYVSPKDVKKFSVHRLDLTAAGLDTLWPPDSIHEQLPNTLGWTAYQDLPHEKYGEVRNVVEVQSRWGQDARDIKQRIEKGDYSRGNTVKGGVHDHPLLHDYNRLILKAFIEQARKDGKKFVSIPDAETVMMSEGQDTHAEFIRANFLNRKSNSSPIKAGDWGVERALGDITVFDSKELAEKNLGGMTGNPALVQVTEDMIRGKIRQEPGMRLNYDTILPKIMEELTGQKGERVELGEHKNALQGPETGYGGYDRPTKSRDNLIFRNPDGTPKTSVTGLVYDISKVAPEKFTLFGRDKLKSNVLEKGVGEPVPDGQSDYSRYTEIQSRMKQLMKDKMSGGDEFQKLWKESEGIKNRNKGMPPSNPLEKGVEGPDEEKPMTFDAGDGDRWILTKSTDPKNPGWAVHQLQDVSGELKPAAVDYYKTWEEARKHIGNLPEVKDAKNITQAPTYRRFDVRTPEGKKMVELRGTQDLLKDLGIEPGIAKWGGERAANQGPQAYTAFNKLSVEQLYDKWDLVKKAKEQSDKDWRQTAKTEHPDVGGDAVKMADANTKHDFVEAAFKELQRRFDQKGVETGFDREAARLEKMRKADEKISPEAPSNLSPEDSAHYDALQLSDPGSMHDVVSRMAESDEFSPQDRALATYLRDNFEHVLRLAKVVPKGIHETGRGGAVYKGVLHEARLAIGAKETGSIAFKVLEEGTHAALTWQLEHPVTATQKAAVASLKSIMERTKDQLPKDVKFKLSEEGRRISGEPVSGLAYRYNNLHEFVAGLISDPELQVHLNNIQLEGIPLWKKVWHALLDLLDIKPDSALDHALQELTKVGAERGEGWAESVKDYHAANYEGASTPALRAVGMMDQLTREAPSPGSSTVVDKRLKDEFMQRYNAARGWSAPRHATASEDVANKLVRYASARQAAPEIAKWMATDVLGDKWQDAAFDNRLGAVLVEDRLRATEKSFRTMAAKATDPTERAELLAKADKVAHIFAPGEMARQLADPEIAAAIERHKATVQPMAQLQHEKLGGRLAAMGESTDAFVNLISMLSPDDVESAQSMIFGSRKGELTNPMKRGSVFNKPTKGSAPNYDLSYRKISERMIRGNYEQVALRDYYKAMIDNGLAVEEKPGVLPTTAKGGKLSPVTIEMRGSGPGMTRVRKLWVRPDLKPELMQAMATDQPFHSGAVRLLLDAITEVQVQGPTDALYHGANMLAVLAGSQGSKTWLYDVLRKGTPVGFLDSAIRIGYNAVKAYHDAPETQHLWADISRIGAGREKPVHETMITKGLTKLGVPEKIAKGVQPSTWSSAAIRIIDKGGRMAAAKMYDNLVERGLAKSSELDKREFINRMGQYNSRLMTKMESTMRELSLSSFVVAGKNMNRQAMRRLLTNPGFRAANPAAAAKLRVTEALTLISMLAAVPAIVNSLTTGSWKGRPGTPFGAIDTGQDDKATGRPKIIDPLQLLLLRRAMRMTGMEAYRRAQGQGLNASDTAHEMVKDVIGAYIHPWMGPGARAIMTAASGREPAVPMNEGYLLSKNPNSFAANAWASAKNMNPTIAQMMKGEEEGTGMLQTPWQSAKSAIGFKLGRNPSWEERQTALTAKLYPGRQWEQLNVGEKRAVQDQLNKQRDEQPSSRTELGRLAAGEKSYWEQAQRDQDLKESLPKHQQKWLDQQGLRLSGFGTEVTLGKVRLPSTPNEKEALMKAMTANYVEAVKSLMGEKWFNDLDKGKKQEVLDKVLTKARKPVLGRFKGGSLAPVPTQ